MTDELTPEEKAAAEAAAKAEAPTYMTKEQVEAMITEQTNQLSGLFTKLTETLTSGQTPPAPEPKEKLNFYDNPEKAAEELYNQKIAPLQEAYVNNERTRQLQEISGLEHAGDYMSEIQEVLSKAPAALIVQPGYAKEVYHLVTGRHLAEIKEKAKKAEEQKPEFTETQTAGAPPTRKSTALSNEEKAAADGMGVSHDDYKKWRDDRDAMAAASMRRSA